MVTRWCQITVASRLTGIELLCLDVHTVKTGGAAS